MTILYNSNFDPDMELKKHYECSEILKTERMH